MVPKSQDTEKPAGIFLPFDLPEAECSLQPGEHVYKHITTVKHVGTLQTKRPPGKACLASVLLADNSTAAKKIGFHVSSEPPLELINL